MIKKTKKAYEEYLNEIGSNIDDCIYLTNSDRKKYLSRKALEYSLYKNQYGKILRTFDPIAFNVGYNDWSR